jgi:hypothetical protein
MPFQKGTQPQKLALTLPWLRGYNNFCHSSEQTEHSMPSADPLPPDMEALSAFVDSQPPEVREIFHYALAMLLVEEGSASMGEPTTDGDGRTHVQLLTTAGNAFDVVKPALSEPMLEQMLTIMRFAKRKA